MIEFRGITEDQGEFHMIIATAICDNCGANIAKHRVGPASDKWRHSDHRLKCYGDPMVHDVAFPKTGTEEAVLEEGSETPKKPHFPDICEDCGRDLNVSLHEPGCDRGEGVPTYDTFNHPMTEESRKAWGLDPKSSLEENREPDVSRFIEIIADAIEAGVQEGIARSVDVIRVALGGSVGMGDTEDEVDVETLKTPDETISVSRVVHLRREGMVSSPSPEVAEHKPYRKGMSRFGIARDGVSGKLRVVWIVEATGEFYLE
ncbi:hypothetical protein BI084_gp85 [Gordonia phage Terapin]|uniref:Uncharacterized protein n=5 Tax=Terapinvirus terapin TaxID=2734283 RepID=A0A345MBC4_9CAUD|nr:hypothetical protein BI084_gp85 [Gordonia phage Terapin]AVP43361.1 hypothetical protein PBI_DJOKOVIC_84 [Gordonia phage Djokovic]AXH67795.1 hypothetical protein SEA_BEYONCAGE_84 [Gordonia phage Beyoncage]QOC56229.1 hypothetical protein SEA_SIENNA_84 [Gordonia phage Sienna]QOC56654.1 hypothetical protein SEA_BITESIZE_84 [Gordonia phage BiteSize]QYW00886.1 hypothetical protein SEA_MADI_83 [Gordonia phage Madi]